MNNGEYPRDKFVAAKAIFLAQARKLKRDLLVRRIVTMLVVLFCILLTALFFYFLFTRALYLAIYGIFWVITHGA